MKYDSRKCKKILQRIGLSNEAIKYILKGMKILKKNKVRHIDLNLSETLFLIGKEIDKSKCAVETVIQHDMKNVNAEEVFLNLSYENHLTIKKLFILLMEKFEM